MPSPEKKIPREIGTSSEALAHCKSSLKQTTCPNIRTELVRFPLHHCCIFNPFFVSLVPLSPTQFWVCNRKAMIPSSSSLPSQGKKQLHYFSFPSGQGNSAHSLASNSKSHLWLLSEGGSTQHIEPAPIYRHLKQGAPVARGSWHQCSWQEPNSRERKAQMIHQKWGTNDPPKVHLLVVADLLACPSPARPALESFSHRVHDQLHAYRKTGQVQVMWHPWLEKTGVGRKRLKKKHHYFFCALSADSLCRVNAFPNPVCCSETAMSVQKVSPEEMGWMEFIKK